MQVDAHKTTQKTQILIQEMSNLSYALGNKVILTDGREGVILWKGKEIYGLVITKGEGKGDGLFEGKRYFSTDENKAAFIKENLIEKEKEDIRYIQALRSKVKVMKERDSLRKEVSIIPPFF